MEIITNFQKPFDFLSNFFPAQLRFEGQLFKSVENAYQAAKTTKDNRHQFQFINSFQAKRLGKKVKKRKEFEELKLDIMYELVKMKFNNNELLSELLLATEDSEIIEGNTWHDNYWGRCECDKCMEKGYFNNHLGKILMRVREELKNK